MLDINFNESWNELDKLNEARESMSYADVKYLLYHYPDVISDKDRSLLNTAKSIELAIPPTKSDAPRGLKRVCYFYNAHVFELATLDSLDVKKLVVDYKVWLRSHQLNDIKNDANIINKVNIVLADGSHNDFHSGQGNYAADLRSYLNANYDLSNRVDIELKITYSGNTSLNDKQKYKANIVLVLDFYSDKIYPFFNFGTKDSPVYTRGKAVLNNYAGGLFDPRIYPSSWDATYREVDKYEQDFIRHLANTEKNRESSDMQEGVDPTTLFNNPRRLSDLPDQDFIDAGLNKKEYVDKAWDAWRQKKYGANLDWQSHAATNETARKKAEDDYNYALKKLGDVRRYPNKYGRGYYDAPEGVFDLDNFHVAFDKFFEDHDLLKIFDKDGKLKMKGSWGDISKLDRNEAPAKALINLWRAQFSGDKIFKSEWDAQEAKKAALKKAEEDRQAWLKQEYEDIRNLQKDIEDSIENSVDWQTLKKIYADHNKKDADKLSYEVRVMVRNYSPNPSDIDTYRRVVVHILNAVGPGNNDKFDKTINLNIDLDLTDSPDEVVKQLSTILPDLGEIYEALMYLRESWVRYTRSTTYSAIGDKFNYIVFRNPDDKKFYRVKKSTIAVKTMDSYRSDVFSSAHEDSPYYLSIYDDSGQVYDVEYDISWEPVAAKLSSMSDGNGNYKHWSSASSKCAFNLTYGEKVLEDNGIHFKDLEDSCTTVEVTKAPSPINKVFEFTSEYNFFCDSSD